MERIWCYDLWMDGRRYQLWISGKGDRFGGVGAVVELCEKVVVVRWVSDRMMAVVLVFKRMGRGRFVAMLCKLEEVWKRNSFL